MTFEEWWEKRSGEHKNMRSKELIKTYMELLWIEAYNQGRKDAYNQGHADGYKERMSEE